MFKNRKNLWKIADWFAELVAIFIGVYLAFALNNYRIENQNYQQRQQIYKTLYQKFSTLRTEKVINEFKENYIASFLKPYQNNEMPRLEKPPRVLLFTISDRTWTSILQAGGFELLELELIWEINKFFTTVERQKEMTEYFNHMLSKYLLPYYNADISRFYNLETQELKPLYEWYVDYVKYTRGSFLAMDRQVDKVLKILRRKIE